MPPLPAARPARFPALSARALAPVLILLAACAPLPVSPLNAADSATTAPIAAPTIRYADAADLVLPAPVIADIAVRRATALDAAQAPGLPSGVVRLYVEADVVALLRAPRPLPPSVRFLVDLPRDARADGPRESGSSALPPSPACPTPPGRANCA